MNSRTPIALPALQDNYIWLIAEQGRTVCVDPGEAEPVLAAIDAQQLVLDGILLTHHHADHCGGVEGLLEHFPNIPVYGPADARLPMVNRIVAEGDTVSILQQQFYVLEIPGHTRTHIAYYEPTQHWLFCGDTLFSAGCGRIFDGDMPSLYHSLLRLKALPDDTLVFAAHEYTLANLRFALHVEPHNRAAKTHFDTLSALQTYCSLPSSIALEKQINPFLRTDIPSVRQHIEKQGQLAQDDFAVFSALRNEKNNFK